MKGGDYVRRMHAPFLGKRYLLNTNTGEVHDLDYESDACQIEKIKHAHIRMADSVIEIGILKSMFCDNISINGCYHCYQKFHID